MYEEIVAYGLSKKEAIKVTLVVYATDFCEKAFGTQILKIRE